MVHNRERSKLAIRYAYRRRLGRLCTPIRYGESGTRYKGLLAFPVTMELPITTSSDKTISMCPLLSYPTYVSPPKCPEKHNTYFDWRNFLFYAYYFNLCK
ncbi:hypothetical protein HanIR_Chr10g0495641 [Helianthus annuus]|nr:hypothetical protein HanIR_Chr10g0495641 [Helianthus annuus]